MRDAFERAQTVPMVEDDVTATRFWFFRASHFVPSMVVTVVVYLLGLSVTVATGIEVWHSIVLAAAVAFGQFSVGLSNDWLDAPFDIAAGRLDKAVATGDVPAGTARNVAFVLLALGVVTGLVAAPPAGLLHLVFIAAGWTYNLGLKRTVLSPVPYLIGFGTLPSLATLLAPHPVLAPWWATAAGAAFGLAAHFANVVPDVEEDRAAGVAGLPQRVGATGSAILAPLVVLVAGALVLVGMRSSSGAAVAAGGIAVAAAVAGLTLAVTGRLRRTHFPVVMLAALAMVVAIALSGTLV